MTLETQLRSAMADAVATAHQDTDRLVADARRRGLGIRRRRQALSVVGVAAALAVAVTAPTLVAGDHGSTSPGRVTVGTQPRAFDASRASPITGRSNAAALLYAVGLETLGDATDFRGQAYVAADMVQTYAGFSFTPSGSDAAGDVGMNLSRFDPATQKTKPGAKPSANGCDAFMENCHVTTLLDGSVLRTYEMHSTYGTHRGLMRSAELVRRDGVRVLAFASNGSDVSERDEKITRDQPVLTTSQLVAIVSHDWWGVQLPTYFTAQGEQLSPYHEVGGAAVATASPTPGK